jgi:hypothetical protein
MDNEIREIAQSLGHGDLPDETVQQVKRALATEYINDILDGQRSLQLKPTEEHRDGEA